MSTVVARITTLNVPPANRKEALRVLDDLQAWGSKQSGFILGFNYESPEVPERVGRVSLWTSQEAANAVGQMDHTIALRSQLHALAQRVGEGFYEHLYLVRGTIPNLPPGNP